MTKKGRIIVLLVLVAATTGCDHVTKHIAATSLNGMPSRSFFADTVRFEYSENAGGMLSIGADLSPNVRTAIFTIGTGLILLIMAFAAIKFRLTDWSLIGISLACAGGASNWIDRATRGSVVDFLNVGIGTLRTGIFNFADVAVLLGAFILIFSYFRSNKDLGT